jgi:hypothetical protein
MHCSCYGPKWPLQMSDVLLENDVIMWSKSVKHLGVSLVAGPVDMTDNNLHARRFFNICNAVLGNSTHQAQLLILSLVESYCRPALLHNANVVKPTMMVE